MLRDLLRQQGATLGRRYVGTPMKRLGIEAIYRRPNTSKPAPRPTIYPYLLRNLAVTQPNQVWAMDISYIPMARGFVYLAAVVDWFSLRILNWRLSITMDVSFCLEAVEEALSKHDKPEICNTDQGRQFTSVTFTQQLKDNGIAISMDGKGCWRDDVFVKRIWRTIKYEKVDLRAYDSVHEARACLEKYIEFYNQVRPHSSLKAKTPHQVYFSTLPLPRAA
jgi:putative transposase